jgi:hypothetical protein
MDAALKALQHQQFTLTLAELFDAELTTSSGSFAAALTPPFTMSRANS